MALSCVFETADSLVDRVPRHLQPVLAGKAVYAGEFTHIGRDDCAAKRKRVGRDEEVIASNRLASLFQSGSNPGVSDIRRCLER